MSHRDNFTEIISLLFHTSTYMRLKCQTEIISNTSPRFLEKFTKHASLLKLFTSTYMRLKCHTEIVLAYVKGFCKNLQYMPVC